MLFRKTAAVAACLFSLALPAEQTIRFGITTDMHKDLIPDADERLQTFIDASKKQKADFIIDLGDFCFPLKKNQSFVNIWRSSGLPTYNAIGNHDMDKSTKEEFLSFVRETHGRYYSFDVKNFHFVVLDPNNLFYGGKYHPYKNANFYRSAKQRAFIDPEQMEWLKKDLAGTKLRTIVFSHQSLENPAACRNQDIIRKIFEEENKKCGFKKIIAAFSGHDHTNFSRQINGIHYTQLNSMSYSWVGYKYASNKRYSKETYKKYPHLRATATYSDPLYTFVTISDDEINIKGTTSTFMKPHPRETGLTSDTLHGVPFEPKISDRVLRIK